MSCSASSSAGLRRAEVAPDGGWRRVWTGVKLGAAYHCGKKGRTHMSAVELRRKLRNFPSANLSQRIAAA
jgi:hypothetical protein